MAFPVFQHQVTPDQVNPWNNLLGKALERYNAMTETQYKEPNLREALLKSQLANKWYEPNIQSQIGLRNAETGAIPSQIALRQAQMGVIPSQIAMHFAQANRANQLSNLPFAGQLAGPAKEAFALELLKQQYGEDSPVYKNAQRAYETNISAKEGLTDYRSALSETAEKRASSTLAKTAQELQEINSGFMPGTNGQVKLTPEQQESLAGQYNLKLQKDVTDTQTRQKVNLSTNIDKTLDSINVDDLTKYAGATGAIKLATEKSRAPFNRESEEYRDYVKSAKASEILAHQVRQFYGDSIQPSMTQALARLTNPSSWSNNPKLAKQEFETVRDVLKKETQTYRDALKNIQKSPSEENIIEYRRDSAGKLVPMR